MRQYVEQYPLNCRNCPRAKPVRHSPFGNLKPLPVSQPPWQEVSIDFVTGLPHSEGFNVIIVVADRLTKMRHLIPCNETTGAPELARIHLVHVLKLHVLPEAIVSDQQSQFTPAFWLELSLLLKIKPRLSTAFHAQTDGQAERANAVMEHYLRPYVSYQQEAWATFLAIAEFTANNHVSETTLSSPFVAN